jgi:hypothetical protein
LLIRLLQARLWARPLWQWLTLSPKLGPYPIWGWLLAAGVASSVWFFVSHPQPDMYCSSHDEVHCCQSFEGTGAQNELECTRYDKAAFYAAFYLDVGPSLDVPPPDINCVVGGESWAHINEATCCPNVGASQHVDPAIHCLEENKADFYRTLDSLTPIGID